MEDAADAAGSVARPVLKLNSFSANQRMIRVRSSGV